MLKFVVKDSNIESIFGKSEEIVRYNYDFYGLFLHLNGFDQFKDTININQMIFESEMPNTKDNINKLIQQCIEGATCVNSIFKGYKSGITMPLSMSIVEFTAEKFKITTGKMEIKRGHKMFSNVILLLAINKRNNTILPLKIIESSSELGHHNTYEMEYTLNLK